MHCAKNNPHGIDYIYTAVYSKLENRYQAVTITAFRCKLFIMLFILHYCKSVINGLKMLARTNLANLDLMIEYFEVRFIT